jgi:hypothetical protein
MTHRDETFREIRHSATAFDWRAASHMETPPRRRLPDDDAELNALAHDEGWLIPPAEVTRVALRPWQQAVFWGLRVYIVVMLAVMAVGFAKVAAGS